MTFAQIVTIVTSIIGTVLTIGTLFYKLGKFQGKVDGLFGKVDDLREWIKSLADGKGPICATHERRLNDQEDRIDNHETRITKLEQKG
jgi:hypothetical protein